MVRQIRATEDRLWVKVVSEETTTASGLVLPGGASGKALLGCVEEVGPGRRLENGKRVEPDIYPGNVVVFEPGRSVPVNIAGREYRVIRESDVLGVVG